MTQVIVFALFIFQMALPASVIELPDLVRSSDANWKVCVSSENANYQKLGNYAFDAHGAFNSVPESEADFRVALHIDSVNTLVLKIFTGDQLAFESTIESISHYRAFLKALDQAVEYIGRSKNLKGFYSGQLAFLGERSGITELYQSDLFFRKIKALTQDSALIMRPKWSPNGRKLIFTSYYQSGFPDLFLMDVPSGERTILSAFKGANTGGVFTPDGKEVAMTLSVAGNSDLYRIRLEDRKLYRILKTTAIESSPSWSPNGNELVFVSDRSGRPQLYTIQKDGSRLTRLKTNISKNCTEPDWNPVDEDLILFTAIVGGTFQIVEYSIKESRSRILTKSADGALEPCWLSDGRHAIFTERIQTKKRLMLLDTVTKEVSALHSMDFGNVSGAAYRQ